MGKPFHNVADDLSKHLSPYCFVFTRGTQSSMADSDLNDLDGHWQKTENKILENEHTELFGPFKGLYGRLKDKTTPVSDKVKLVRFAWKSPKVFIPNKQQVLIDVLCWFLLNKRKNQLTEDDTCQVWRCLCDILHTNKIGIPNSHGQGLVIRQSIAQVIIEALVTQEADGGHGNIKFVIGCCQAIITSPMLCYLFTSRFESMVNLMVSLCRLLPVCSTEVKPELSSLIQQTVEQYIKVQKTAPNQNQILHSVCEKLVPVFIALWQETRSQDVTLISQAILGTLCHQDHCHGYSGYLTTNHSEADTKRNVKSKSVENVFSTFSKLLLQEELAGPVCRYLPLVFHRYVKQYHKEEDSQTTHYMLMELCSLIGLKSGSPALSGTLAPPAVIRGVNQLLEVVQKYETYDVNQDERNKWNQLEFYKHLVQVLLTNRCLTVDWFSSLRVLLQLNHHILESSLTEILSAGWTKKWEEVPDDVTGARDSFMQDLVMMYSKLRQLPKLITKLIDTLCGCHGNSTFSLSTNFLQRFGEVVQAVPQGMTIDIWKKFVECLKQKFVVVADSPSTGDFVGLCSLFHQYLLNIKVADYTITDMTTNAVQELLVTMETEILTPLLHIKLEDKALMSEKLSSTLLLCHGWGEIVAMLALYTGYRASDLQAGEVVSHSGDLSCLHSYLETGSWCKLYKRVKRSHSPALQYVWDMLCIQRMKACLLFRDVSTWPVLQESMATLMTFPDDLGNSGTATWTGELAGVTPENLPVARWHLLASSMCAIQAAASEQDLKNMAVFVVATATCQEPAELGVGQSLAKVAEDLLKSDWMKENRTLLTNVVTATWDRCKHCFSRNVASPKKKKLAPDLTCLMSLLAELSNFEVSTNHSNLGSHVEKASEYLTSLLAGRDVISFSPDLKTLKTCLQILSNLPLEFLSSYDQRRCLIGLLAMRAVLERIEDQSERRVVFTEQHRWLSDRRNVTDTCVELCMALVERSESTSVFRLVDLDTYFTWMQTVLSNMFETSESYNKMLLLAEISNTAIVEDNLLLGKLPPFVEKLCNHMKKKTSLKKSDTGALSMCVFLQHGTSKMLNKSQIPGSRRAQYNTVFLPLTMMLLELSPLLTKGSLNEAEARLTQSFCAILSSNGIHPTLKEKYYENFRIALEWCEKVMDSDLMEVSVHGQVAALNFLLVICKHHDRLDDCFPPPTKIKVLEKLIVMLRKLLQIQSTLHRGQSMHPIDQSHHKRQNATHSDGASQDVHSDQGLHRHATAEMDSGKSRDQATLEDVSALITGTSSSLDLIRNKGRTEDCNLDYTHIGMEEKATKVEAISALYRCSVFDGSLESQRSKLLLMQVQSTMAVLLASFDLEHFTKVIQDIVIDVHPDRLLSEGWKIQSSLYLWRHLLRQEFSEDQTKVLRYAAKNLMLTFQSILEQLGYHGNSEVVLGIILPVLNTQKQMLEIGPKFLSSKVSILCLHSCLHSPLEGSTYIPVFQAVTVVMDTLLLKHKETVLQNIPAYIACAKRLLMSVVEQSNQETVSQDSDVTSQLVVCAYKMVRMFTEISTHKVEFSKVAMYVVADYVTVVQKVTLLPAIKRALVPAVYKMLDLCDTFAVAQLHVVLGHGVTEVFRILYQEYTKFYKYTGKV